MKTLLKAALAVGVLYLLFKAAWWIAIICVGGYFAYKQFFAPKTQD